MTPICPLYTNQATAQRRAAQGTKQAPSSWAPHTHATQRACRLLERSLARLVVIPQRCQLCALCCQLSLGGLQLLPQPLHLPAAALLAAAAAAAVLPRGLGSLGASGCCVMGRLQRGHLLLQLAVLYLLSEDKLPQLGGFLLQGAHQQGRESGPERGARRGKSLRLPTCGPEVNGCRGVAQFAGTL